MKVIGPLMWEHRLIERMVALVRTELQSIKKGSSDTSFIDAALDFFKIYAERLHFGKEEDILFAGLRSKKLSAELNSTMATLIEEHASLVQKTDAMVSIREEMNKGGDRRLMEMIEPVEEMLGLYPAHMEREDKQFFYPCLEYLSQQEQDEMLEEFQEFDAKLIHERYKGLVARLENTAPASVNPGQLHEGLSKPG